MSIKYYYFFIPLLILITTLPGLGVLEFFRHTEADRTLISQEMVENGNLVVPHLLGQPILTKPPVYYILSAAIFKIFGSYNEFESRLVSVFAACLLALTHFAACRFNKSDIEYSIGSTLVLITTVAFFNLSAVAEIDMLYAAFCACSLYSLFFSYACNSLLLLLLSYIFAAIAFLTKGPPIIAFFALSSLIYYFLYGKKEQPVSKYIVFNLLGVLCFLGILCIWFMPLVNQIDFVVLKEQFNQEILGRAIGQPRKARGLFFYIISVLGAALPWSFPAVLCLFFARPLIKAEKLSRFLSFCLIVFLSGLVILSLAKGKSSRYIFPLHTFVVQLVFFILSTSRSIWLRPKFSFYLKVALYFLAASVLIASFIISAKFNKLAIIYFLPFVFFAILSFLQLEIKKIFLCLVFCILSTRIALTQVYYPYRNAKKSVKPIVSSIIKEAKSAPIFSAGMYERWISYYLKRAGIQVLQLQGLNSYQPKEENIYWLITDKDESDLLELVRKDSSSRLLKSFSLPSTNVYLFLSPTNQALQMLDYIKKTRKDDGIF